MPDVSYHICHLFSNAPTPHPTKTSLLDVASPPAPAKLLSTCPPSCTDTRPELVTSSLPGPEQKAQPPPQHHHHPDDNPRQLEYRDFVPLLRHPAQSARGAFYRGRH